MSSLYSTTSCIQLICRRLEGSVDQRNTANAQTSAEDTITKGKKKIRKRKHLVALEGKEEEEEEEEEEEREGDKR